MSISQEEFISLIKRTTNTFAEIFLDFLRKHINYLIIGSFFLSIFFGIIKTTFFTGFNVDSYQYYAESLEKWIKTGTPDDLFNIFYARNRIVYPLIIAVVHILIPIDISLLACGINLLFALANIYLIRRLLFIYEFKRDEVNFLTLFNILSYNFLNYWFNIITDMVGLFFFLLMMISLEFFLNKENSAKQKGLYLSLSCFFLILAIFTRELYILAVLLYFSLIRSRKLRIIAIILTIAIVFLLINVDPGAFPFMNHVIPPEYKSEYLHRDYLTLFLLLQQKWINIPYIQNYFKGLLKTGILPAVIIISTSIITLFIKKGQRFILPIEMDPRKNLNIMSVWCILFFAIYTIYYSNVESASGLRYWLPISWIPLAYAAKIIIRYVKIIQIKVLFILFLCLFPLLWSSLELYANRNVSSGTGPLLHQNYYYNSMSDLSSIDKYDSKYLGISVVNGSYLKTIVTPAAIEDNESHPYVLSFFTLALWLNISRKAIIQVRLKTPNEAYWGITVYQVHPSYAPWIGPKRFEKQILEATPEFRTYTFEITETFLIRHISLSIGGKSHSSIYWDFIRVYNV